MRPHSFTGHASKTLRQADLLVFFIAYVFFFDFFDRSLGSGALLLSLFLKPALLSFALRRVLDDLRPAPAMRAPTLTSSSSAFPGTRRRSPKSDSSTRTSHGKATPLLALTPLLSLVLGIPLTLFFSFAAGVVGSAIGLA